MFSHAQKRSSRKMMGVRRHSRKKQSPNLRTILDRETLEQKILPNRAWRQMQASRKRKNGSTDARQEASNKRKKNLKALRRTRNEMRVESIRAHE